MLVIPLQTIPNQTFSFQADGDLYYCIVRNVSIGLMAIDITKNSIVILTGQRLVPSYPVIPYLYLQTGNFIFITLDDNYPDYTQFGISQFLVYLSPPDIEAINGST